MKGSCIKLGSRRVALRCDVNMQYGRAEIFDRQYGAMLRRPPLSELTSARYLLRALEAKGIVVTEGVLKQWLLKYRTGDAAATGSGSIKSAIDLHEAHGAELQALPPENEAPYMYEFFNA